VRQPESFASRHHARGPMGILIAAGEDGVGASVTAALLAREAQADGARVLIIGPALRAQRIAALLCAARSCRTARRRT
jgi:Mrp family chromosome partitioning ATPase